MNSKSSEKDIKTIYPKPETPNSGIVLLKLIKCIINRRRKIERAAIARNQVAKRSIVNAFQQA